MFKNDKDDCAMLLRT